MKKTISVLLVFGFIFAMGEYPKENTIYLISDDQAYSLVDYSRYSKVATTNTMLLNPSINYKHLSYTVHNNKNPYLALDDYTYGLKVTDGKNTGWIVSKNVSSDFIKAIPSQLDLDLDKQRKQREAEFAQKRIKAVDVYIAQNPKSKKYQQNLIKGEVVKGMNLDDVKLCWGEPDVFNQLSVGYYQFGIGRPVPRKYCYFRNGVVMDIQYFNY
ncbi:hypothetical protein NO1_1282 [Candidatus Termititenax aidoneus]|uniref:Uncharacterized protein n=1 Tax=Termititenax aidoneus TaxID=2218524 RepID=A0A388TC49_TERA1|nr:hypothetical protein NO1_1282 [Candidatus Termititenax aidoneus]